MVAYKIVTGFFFYKFTRVIMYAIKSAINYIRNSFDLDHRVVFPST